MFGCGAMGSGNVRGHPYIMSHLWVEVRVAVWRSVTEHYETSDKFVTGGWEGLENWSN